MSAKETSEGKPAKKAQAPKAATEKGAGAKQTAAIRTWAKANGMPVGPGRIPAKIRQAYEAAHRQATDTADKPEQEAPAAPSADELKKRMQEKTAQKTAEAAGPAHRVLVGKIVDGVDQEAVRKGLENPDAAAIYNETKPLVTEYTQVDGRATELLRQISHKLMDLRGLFKDAQGRVDWNGESPQYVALAASLLREAGVPSDSAAGTRRAIGHHIEDRKRERVPQAEWADYGVQALTRGQRAGLEKKQAKALVEADKAVKDITKKGGADNSSMLVLARKIDAGISAYNVDQLAALNPKQRNMFRESLEETRQKTEALLAKLQELEAEANPKATPDAEAAPDAASAAGAAGDTKDSES
ncbi:histone-like nucleoid-structuring protein Lsr2 [Streptomyces sp. NPDC059080]|uniref:Lsr2 family DNA-binding protein n=1 Tax=Streptomyces sp. NPDC059080 TaxID=3346718 RepID=UPI0036A5F7E3